MQLRQIEMMLKHKYVSDGVSRTGLVYIRTIKELLNYTPWRQIKEMQEHKLILAIVMSMD